MSPSRIPIFDSIFDSVFDSIFNSGSSNSTSIHQFYYSASTRLRSPTFNIRLDDESRVGTPLCRYLVTIDLNSLLWLKKSTGVQKNAAFKFFTGTSMSPGPQCRFFWDLRVVAPFLEFVFTLAFKLSFI